ncbi:MAG: efflux RND transporter periplasmic adaptor subunit [Candidatus Krumholzibacteria bacterium]|nr:efflux RND transporter periplasmic adaptor subunit [Candidatus Krumholzibacteria bacterium]
MGVVLIVSTFVMTTGCGSGDDGAGSEHAAKATQAQKSKGQRPDRRGPKQPPVPVAVAEASEGSIASYYTATATLAAEKQAQILARATGVVQSLKCEEGDKVRQGRELLKIADDEYRLRVEQAVATTANLRDRRDRLKGMWDQQLVSAEQFESASNELKAAEAAEGLARLNLSYTRVKAPFTGRIVERLVDEGQNVSTGTPLFTISDFDPLLAIVHVPSKEFKKLKPDQPVTLTIDSSKEQLVGRIKLVSPIIDPNSGTIKVTIEIPQYPAQTRPGDFAEVRIVTERRTDRTLVPRIAVFTDEGDRVVYVAADSTAERRVVEVGFEDDKHTEILSGIAQGERIVVKGQRSLKHGAPIKILEGQTTGRTPTEQAGS